MDRTTESFVQSIKRMANRRSMPNIIHSDNASEIIKAEKYIKELYEILNTTQTHKELLNKYNIKWYHSAERSPTHNGVVERIVQTVKRPLYRVLDGKVLTESEMNTVLTDCEASCNMRPLSAISESADDNNLLSLTPSHLILGKALLPLPTDMNSYEDETIMGAKEKWRQRKHISNQYWRLWREEYLVQLRQLTKNYCNSKDLKKGDLVLLIRERINKLHWPIAIVEEALPGRDNKTRSVWLRLPITSDNITKEGKHLTQHKYVKRGIEQVSLLEEALEEHHQASQQATEVAQND